MPFYNWSGIDFSGKDQRGCLFAASPEDLERQLATQAIGLIQAKVSFFNAIKLFFVKPSLDMQCNLLEHLSILLQSKIRFYDAIILISSTSTNSFIASALSGIANRVKNGESLEEAFRIYPDIFDSVTCTLLQVGESTSSLGIVLKNIVEHKRQVAKLNAKLKSRLMLPLFTLAFFVTILLLLFLVVIPQFELIFGNFDKAIPPITLKLFALSKWCRSATPLYALISLALLFLAGKKILKFCMVKVYLDNILLKVPIINRLIITYWRIHCLKTISIMLLNQLPLNLALDLAKTVINNVILKNELEQIVEQVNSGAMLSTVNHNFLLFDDPHLQSFFLIGENSGDLGNSFEFATLWCQERLNKLLSQLIMFVQPTLLLVLGGFISLLLGALYVALLDMSSLI